MVILLTRTIKGDSPELLYNFYPWAENLISRNSSLNPIIYCWRNCEIRRAVFRVINSVTSPICWKSVEYSVDAKYVTEATSRTPKSEYETNVTRTGVLDTPETMNDIEVLSICSRE